MEQSSDYSEKFKTELSNFQNLQDVHALPAIFHYWSERYLLPKIQALGFESLVGLFIHYLSEGCNRRARAP